MTAPAQTRDAAREMVRIYSPEGEPMKVTRLNGIDLVRTNGFSWNPPNRETPASEPVEETEAAPVETPAPVEVKPFSANADVDLEDVAHDVIGERDVAKYLQGFSVEALRTLAEERYNEKVHARASKETVIERIVGFEEARANAKND